MKKCEHFVKSGTNHTFLEQIDHIEGRNFKISNDLLQIYTFWSLSLPRWSYIGNLLFQIVWTVQIRKIWFVDIFRFFSCLHWSPVSLSLELESSETLASYWDKVAPGQLEATV